MFNKSLILALASYCVLAIAFPSPQNARTLKLPAINDENLEEEIHKVYEQDAEEGSPGRYLVNVAYTTADEDDLTAAEDDRQARSAEIFESEVREKRSLQPGAPVYGGGQEQVRNHGVDIDRDDGKNTRVRVHSQHKGEKFDVDGEWSKVVRGPGKAKPNWRVGVKWWKSAK